MHGQYVIAKQSHGQSSFLYLPNQYNDQTVLQPIFNALQNGDTLYLPPLDFQLNGNLYLNKGAVIVGAGADVDSITSGITQFSNYGGKLVFQVGSDNAEVHGARLDKVAISQSASDVISGIKFYRCDLWDFQGSQSNNFNHISNLTMKGCILHNIDLAGVHPIQIEGCFITTLAGAVSGTTVLNCDIGAGWAFDASSQNRDVVYQNNIILYNTNAAFTVNEHSTFTNNAWVFNSGASLAFGSNIVSQANNNYWTSLYDMFVSWYNPNDYQTFLISSSDLHLVATQAYTMAVGGGQVGMYGASYKWKDGMVPFNPHWVSLQCDQFTTNAYLGIAVKATAQNPDIAKIKALRFWADQSQSPSDIQVIGFNPAQRVLDYSGAIDFCASTRGGAVTYFFQLQDDAGSWSRVLSNAAYITPGAVQSVNIQLVPNGAYYGLSSNAPYGNQWYVDGNPISGATGQNYTPQVPGNYTDIVTNDCGSATSNSLFIASVGINEITQDGFAIYPNPNKGTMTLKMDNPQNATLTVYNELGEVVLSQAITTSSTPIQNDFAGGLYTAQIQNAGKRYAQRISIIR